MSTTWTCQDCTFENNMLARCCEICLCDRSTPKSNGAAAAALAAGNHAAIPPIIPSSLTSICGHNIPPPNQMTPILLSQIWMSCKNNTRQNVIYFSSRPGTNHHPMASRSFSNFYPHAPATFTIPDFCRSVELTQVGNRPSTITFTFAEKAIMLCKASLFGDYNTFDQILHSVDGAQAKNFGRQVQNFHQNTWERSICPIMREVAIAKMQAVPEFKAALLAIQQDDALIAEASGDWVWGVGLDVNSGAVHHPSRWRGSNILGWALMEARVVAKQQAMMVVVDTDHATHDEPKPSSSNNHESKKQRLEDGMYDDLSFGPEAFGPLQRDTPAYKGGPDLHSQIRSIVESSFPEARSMRGERDRKQVTRMLSDIYQNGLFMHGDINSPVNAMVIPAMKHVFAEINDLPTNDGKRISMIKTLVHACQDCQQVQAREILKMYGDLTVQSQTFEQQLKYSLLGQKEAALQVLITNSHGGMGGVGKPLSGQTPHCDRDHTQCEPSQQRAHLISGYASILGENFGLDGITAARGDRFLSAALQNIGVSHNVPSLGRGSPLDRCTMDRFLSELQESMSVKDWIAALLADINNQTEGAERMMDRSCIFTWAGKNMEGNFKHDIFYDESRAAEFSDLDPKKPTEANEYEPFLSPRVLVEMLLKAGMLKRNDAQRSRVGKMCDFLFTG